MALEGIGTAAVGDEVTLLLRPLVPVGLSFPPGGLKKESRSTTMFQQG
jgi:hypothetical protein